jgi:uncharacterized protein YcbK (DUF882 family)
MYVQQNVSILYFLRKSKMTKDGKSPLYFRLTIDGLQEEMSTGIKVTVQGWNVKLKQVTDIERDYKLHNKRLRKIETDLERLVDLVQATDQLATPAKVLAAYKTPVRGTKIREERKKISPSVRALTRLS